MDLFKMFGIQKLGIEEQLNNEDTELINKLHGFWSHIKHPVLGMMEREDMHIMGVDELLDRINVGPQQSGYDLHPKTGKPVPGWIPETLTSKGMGKPFLTDVDPDTGYPTPLDRTSLMAGLDNPEHWGFEDLFSEENE